MSFTATLCLVLAAVYALTSLLLSIAVALSWHLGLERRPSGPDELLALRLLPSVGAAFLTLTVALPAFLIHEPRRGAELAGPLLVVLALFALLAAGLGLLRGWRAGAATRALLRHCGPADRCDVGAGRCVEIVRVSEPVAAVVGVWRPRILAADCVRAACSDAEFRQVIAHEAAHVAAHDNAKLLLQIIGPDALAWMPAGRALTERWRAATELEADARASGCDPRQRVALAAALLKVARLSSGTLQRSRALSMPVAVDDVAGRVRELLAPLPMPHRPLPTKALVACALLIIAAGVPLYEGVHESIESLVAFGAPHDGLP
jgi:Zn-dependent protease with chaperone function